MKLKREVYNVAGMMEKLFSFWQLVYTRNTPDIQEKYARVIPLAVTTAGQKYGLLSGQGKNNFFDVRGQFELAVKPREFEGTRALVVSVAGGPQKPITIRNDEYARSASSPMAPAAGRGFTRQTKKSLAPDENLKGVYIFSFKTWSSDREDLITTRPPDQHFRILQYRADSHFAMLEFGVTTQLGVQFLVAQEKYVGRLRKDSGGRLHVLGHSSLNPWKSFQEVLLKLTEGVEIKMMTELEEAELGAPPLGVDLVSLAPNEGVVTFFDPLLHGGKGEIIIPPGVHYGPGNKVINVFEPTAARVHFKNCEAEAGAVFRIFFADEVVQFKHLAKPEPKIGKDGQEFISGYPYEAKGVRLAEHQTQTVTA